jgi:hypothetical protein
MSPQKIWQAPRWIRLGRFTGAELTSLRERLRTDGIAQQEELRPGPDGEPCTEISVTSVQLAQAVAVTTGALAVAARQARRSARRQTALRRGDHERWHRRQRMRRSMAGRPRENLHEDSAVRAVRIAFGLLVALFVTFAIIIMIGERYGTRAPVPGHHGKTIPCSSKYQVCF